MRAPPASNRPMIGARARNAMSWILVIFCACVSDSAPPNTVKSLAKTKTLRPFTVPQPVTTPSPAILVFSMPKSFERCSTNMSNSSNEFLSMSSSMRSRAVSLPRLCCASMRRWPPPPRALARRSSSLSRMSFMVRRWPVGWSSPLPAARPASPPARRRELQWRSSIAGRAHGVTAPYSAASGHAAVSSRSPPRVKAQTVKRKTHAALTMFQLIDAVERRPRAAFAAFLFLHAVVWTALPAILYLNLPLDLIEALTYGREWQLGYDKLPPLPWWLIEIVYRVFGVDTAYSALAQAVVVIAFVLVWKTARPLVGALGALVAILIIDGMHYFNFTAAKFNHDVIQLPFWALAGFAFHAGLRRGGIGYWALLGAALGCALWAKYFVAVLVAPLVLFMLLDRQARRRLAAPGPWVAAAVALLIMAPHLVWLVQNDFLPFHYAEARALPARGPLDHLLHPFQFLGGQFFFIL